MATQELGGGWFAEVGQEYPVEAWAFSVYHDAGDPDYDSSWWAERKFFQGFVSKEQAEEAVALFLQHEALMHCEVHSRGWDERHEAVELVQVFYRFATRSWSYRLCYEPNEVTGWVGYYTGSYDSAITAIRAGQAQWEKLRSLGTGGADVDPGFKTGQDFYG
jgi:hypothetical protein